MKSFNDDTYLKLYDSILNIKSLTLTDKVVLCEIINLCTIKGCFASRGHFCNRLNIKSKTTISNSWKKLKDLGYIKIRRKICSTGVGDNVFTIIDLTVKTLSLLPKDLKINQIEDIEINGGEGLVVS